jgi:hypothetical protein
MAWPLVAGVLVGSALLAQYGGERSEGQYAGIDKENFMMQGQRDRAGRLLDVYGQGAAQMGEIGGFGEQQQTIDELRKASTEGDPYARAMLQQQAYQTEAQALGTAAGRGDDALAYRTAIQAGAGAKIGAAHSAGMADVRARQGALGKLVQAGGQLTAGQLQHGQANLKSQMFQRQLGMDALRTEGQNAYRQASLLAGYEGQRSGRAAGELAKPTWTERFMGTAGPGLAAAGMMGGGGGGRSGVPAALQSQQSQQPDWYGDPGRGTDQDWEDYNEEYT